VPHRPLVGGDDNLKNVDGEPPSSFLIKKNENGDSDFLRLSAAHLLYGDLELAV
jgi:hypothetical protein